MGESAEERRRFLTEEEIRKLLLAAKQGKYGTRDHLMILMAFRHAFRVSELIDVRITDLDLKAGRIFVRRLKSSTPTTQPIPGDVVRAIRALLRLRSETSSPYLFLGERGPFTRQAVNYLVRQAGERAKLEIRVHPHMLRHSMGYCLVNRGCDTRLMHDYLGHVNINHTVRYTKTAAFRFEGLCK